MIWERLPHSSTWDPMGRESFRTVSSVRAQSLTSSFQEQPRDAVAADSAPSR